jgi:ketosteroid isomerase-like protein
MTTMSRLASLAFILLCSASAFGQNLDGKAELQRLLNEFLAGAGRNDAAVHDRFWADDLIYTRAAGSRIGKLELMKGVRSAPPRKFNDPVTVYTGEDVRIQEYGDVAVVAFKLVAATTKTDGSREVQEFLNTGTFVKRKGVWQVVAWQATAIPKPKQ